MGPITPAQFHSGTQSGKGKGCQGTSLTSRQQHEGTELSASTNYCHGGLNSHNTMKESELDRQLGIPLLNQA